MHQDRLALMRQTRENMATELKGVLAELKLSPEWEDIVFSFPKKKFQHLSVRGPFAVAIYGYLKEQARGEGISLNDVFPENLFTTQLPFIAEMAMVIQYLENHILDGKDGVNPVKGLDWELIKDKLLASHYLKDFLYSYVRQRVFPEACPEREILLDCLRRMFQFTEEGQFAERRWSSLEHVRNGIPNLPPFSREVEDSINYELIEEVWSYFLKFGMNPQRESFARFYLKRMYCTNAQFFILLSECIARMINYHGKRLNTLRYFSAGFGLIAQMVNDICDYLPASYQQATSAKIPEDAYSDLRNNNLTLPFLFVVEDFEMAKKLLSNDMYSDDIQHKWFDRVKDSCGDTIIPMLRSYAKELKKNLNSPNSNATIQLGDFTSIVYNRRYFKYFEL